jgi:hypothetical protein
MRERWFFVQGERRRGPLTLAGLVRAIRSELDPRAVLVWRKGLRDWTLAEVVPEVARELARASSPDDTQPLPIGEARSRPAPAPARTTARRHLRLGLAALAIAIGTSVVVLQLRSPWPRGASPGVTPSSPASVAATMPSGVPPPAAPAAQPTASSPSSVALAPMATASGHGATPPPVPATLALAEEEADLPGAEIAKLRGVAAWSGDTLKLTVYNATGWRVTEIQVSIERFTGQDFVADDRPLSLVPPQQRVETGVDALLSRVAPDRKKPGLNALDTGVFQVRAGAAPEGFRWAIASARGYPPSR